MLFAFVARVNQYLSARKESGIPDQKGVLDMIRGLPEDYLFPCNNKVWHGTAALHFCFFCEGADCRPLQLECKHTGSGNNLTFFAIFLQLIFVLNAR